MLDPDLTNILKRRIGASLIDLGIVGLVTAAVWRTQLIAFPITSTDAITGDPIFDPAQLERQAEIAERLNTSFTWNNTLYALDQSGFVLTGLCAIVMLAMVFVLIPANTGWSPGKKLLSLGVVDADGRNPSLADHAKRSLVGIVDLMPVVVPGLAGWVIANTDEYRQRLGDRVANTYVIDNRAGPKFIDPTVYERRRELRRATIDNQAANDDDDMVEIGDRIGGSPSGLHRIEDELPAEPSLGEQLPAAPEFEPVAPQVDEAHADPDPDPGQRSEAPGPSHRFTVDAEAPTNELGFVDTDQLGLGFGGSPAAMPTSTPEPEPEPEPERAPSVEPVEHEPAHAAEMALPTTIDLDAAPHPTVRAKPTSEAVSVPKPTHRGITATTEPEWEQPIPEEAPVWEPRREPAPVVADVTTETDQVVEPAEDPVEVEQPVAARSTGEPSQSAPGLVWNDQWQAWLFWDSKHQHWLRHDIANDRWIPIG